MINHYDNETRLTAILRCVVDNTADAAMLLQLGPARTREEIFISRALGKKPWAAIPPRTTLEMWLAFIADDEAEPVPGSYTVRSCAESCVITYARRVKGATAIVPIFPPHDPYEIALAKLAGVIPVSYGVQGLPWELLINQLADRGPRENVTVIYGSTPKREGDQITPTQDLHGYGHPWPGGEGKNLWNKDDYPIFNGYFGSESGRRVIVAASNHTITWIPCAPNTTYTISRLRTLTGEERFQAGWSDAEPEAGVTVNSVASAANNGVIGGEMKLTVTTGANALYLVVWAWWAPSVNAQDTMQIELGPIATAWTPYANICPVTPGLDMLRDNGDRLVVWSGEINTGAGKIISRSAEISSYAGEQLPGPWISSMDTYAPGTTPTSGAQVVYELSEPVIYRLSPTELQRALGCTKYLGVGVWKLCPGVMTVITAQLTTGEATDRYDLAPSTAEGWTFDISVDGQAATGAAGALSVAAGDHSITITATPAAGAATCYIHPTLYSEEATP